MSQQATPSRMDTSGRDQRSGLVWWAGLMNGSRIAAHVTAGSRNLCGKCIVWIQPVPCKTLPANGNTLKFCYFVIRACYKKGRMPQWSSKFCPELSVRLKDIAEKIGPREAETDSRYWPTDDWGRGPPFPSQEYFVVSYIYFCDITKSQFRPKKAERSEIR